MNGVVVHLRHRDVTMLVVSRAPYEALAAYKERMGWSFTWVSSSRGTFSRDYGVSCTPEEVAMKRAFSNCTYRDPISPSAKK